MILVKVAQIGQSVMKMIDKINKINQSDIKVLAIAVLIIFGFIIFVTTSYYNGVSNNHNLLKGYEEVCLNYVETEKYAVIGDNDLKFDEKYDSCVEENPYFDYVKSCYNKFPNQDGCIYVCWWEEIFNDTFNFGECEKNCINKFSELFIHKWNETVCTEFGLRKKNKVEI